MDPEQQPQQQENQPIENTKPMETEQKEEGPRKRKQEANPMSKHSQKKRKVDVKKQNEGVCLTYMRTGKCEREQCKYSHDIKTYLSRRTDYQEGECPLFSIYGMCPSGLTCQWCNSHKSEENNWIVNEEKMKENPYKPSINVLPGETLHQLRKKNYQFDIPTSFEKPESTKQLDFKEKLILPSLCTFGNLPFRKTVKRMGCDITMNEMVMADALCDGKASEWALIKRDPLEDIFGVQLCVGNPNLAAKAVHLLDKIECDFYELNAACPIDLVYNKGMGAKMFERPRKIQEIIHAMRGVTERPVTLKLRTGKDTHTIDQTILPTCHEYGASIISIHGRTREQRYTKMADWNFIQKATEISQVPIVGIGDIYSYKDYQNAIASGVHAVGIARGALMKPWIFTEIKEKRDWDISSSERLDILKQYAYDGLAHWGSDLQGVNTTREFLCHHLTFMSRYVPVHCCVETNQDISIKVKNDPSMCYRDDMEKLLTSDNYNDYIKITEMFLGPAPKEFVFVPKHKSYVKM